MEMMISTLTASSTASGPNSPAQLFTLLTQQPSPFLLENLSTPLLTHYFNGTLSDSILFYSIPSTIRNLLGKEAQEIKDGIDSLVPKVLVTQTLKKVFREFYSREQLHVLEFLEAPLASRHVTSQVVTIVKRFGRSDYSATKVKIKDLVLDLNCNTVFDTLQTEFNLNQTATFQTWIQQTKLFFDRWKTAIAEFDLAEKRLEAYLTVFQDVQKRVQMILGLPLGDGYDALLASMETYLKAQFEEHRLEPAYQAYLVSLKKLIVLSDAVGAIRALVNTPLEPLCPICFAEPVSLAYEPCGHTLCGHCNSRQSSICAICRCSVRDRLRLYFS